MNLKSIPFISVLLGGTTLGADPGVVPVRGTPDLRIVLDEPVVSLTVAKAGRLACRGHGGDSKLSPADLGQDLFEVTGDPEHRPAVYWEDQNRLLIRPAKGTSVATEFSLKFKPGVTYLSGKPLARSEYRFHAQDTPLGQRSAPAGVPGLATIVGAPSWAVTREALSLSPQSPLSFSYVEVPKDGKKARGRKVAAVAEPLLFKHAPELLDLSRAAAEDIRAVTGDTVIPGAVLVRPAEPLPDGTRWELAAAPAAGSGLLHGGAPICTVQNELRTGMTDYLDFPVKVENGKAAAPARPEHVLEVQFSAPVDGETARRAFRDMGISIGGVAAATAADGLSKTLVTGSGTYTFAFDRLLYTFALGPGDSAAPRLPGRQFGGYGDDEEPAGAKPAAEVSWSYAEPDSVSGFRVKVQAPMPALAEFTLKAGSCAKLGLPMTRDHVHRLNLNPAAPRVDLESGAAGVLPLHGEHKMRLQGTGCRSVSAKAYRWDAAAAVNAYERVAEVDGRALSSCMEKYRRVLEELRLVPGLADKEDVERARRSAKQAAADVAARWLKVKSAMATAHAYAEHTLPLESPRYADTAEQVLDLDTLTGGNTQPGLYLVALKQEPDARAAAALESVGLAAADMAYTTCFMVQVTDLHQVELDDGSLVLVTDRVTGKPVEKGEVVLSRKGKDAPVEQRFPVVNGLARLEPAAVNVGSADLMPTLVCSGEDYLIPAMDKWDLRRLYSARTPAEERVETRAESFTDRRLYRPGETVHYHAVVRECRPGNVSALPADRRVSLRVRKPNGKTLVEQKDLLLDEFGAVDFSFTLPDGEEDVTGDYSVRLGHRANSILDSISVDCQVFRRDSFEPAAKLELEQVGAGAVKVSISARDLNGTPLSGAKVEYRLRSDCTLGHAEVPAEGVAALGADGVWEKVFSVKPAEGNKGNRHQVILSGTVTNDREEVQRFGSSSTFYNADFTVDFDNSTRRLTLQEAAGAGKPLARDQRVHVVLKGRVEVKRETLPNGFTAVTRAEKTLWEGDVDVPANSREGVKLARLDEALAQAGDAASLTLAVSGTDTAGRSFTDHPYFWVSRYGKEDEADCRFELEKAEPGSGAGHVPGGAVLSSGQAGTAALLVCSGSGAVRGSLLEVKEGENAVAPEYLPGETGSVGLRAVMPAKDKRGFYTRMLTDSLTLDIPAPQRALGVQLDLPAESCRPGAKLLLGGSVTLPDGKPADAEVTFYAVDAGMLSVTGYSMPQLERAFSAHCRIPYLGSSRHDRYGSGTAGSLQAALLEGVWRGECSSRKEDGFRVYRYGYVDGPSLHAARVPAVNRLYGAKGVAADEDCCVAEECCADGMLLAAAVPCVEANEAAPARQAAPAAKKAKADAPAPRLRTDFAPVALWQGAARTDAQGRFGAELTLPDTLTTYRVFAVAVDKTGDRFGQAEGKLEVNQPLMLTAGTPFFMSTGDRLLLPLTVTNNTDAEGTWQVQLQGAGDAPAQEIRLAPRATGTLKFEVAPQQEGTCTLDWVATAAGAPGDAVQGKFPVRFPAPLLKEAHHLVLTAQEPLLTPAALLAPELASSTRGELAVELSANPLLHLAGCVDFMLGYPYGCTEQTSTGLLPWLMYDRLAPVCPQMAETPAPQAHQVVDKAIARLLKRQKADGGLGYWDDSPESCLWASAHAALVLDLAADYGYAVDKDRMDALRAYLRKEAGKEKYREHTSALTRYEVARALGDSAAVKAELAALLEQDRKHHEDRYSYSWWCPRSVHADLALIYALETKPQQGHAAFLDWMRTRGHDYRHYSTWQGAWTLIALHEYLRRQPDSAQSATVRTADGTTMALGNGVTSFGLVQRGQELGKCPAAYTATQGTVYAIVCATPHPNTADYPGVTEKGLQITRLYEKKGADGVWRPATEFCVGDVVRVTLTCAKMDRDLEYFVLEDYLPACMEAVNPAIRSQAAGLESCAWSRWFDHKEYLADRVRGFCTRWAGRDLLNMRYYARVKRAGVSTAPPAQAQLMYEPQTYGLSPNMVITSK